MDSRLFPFSCCAACGGSGKLSPGHLTPVCAILIAVCIALQATACNIPVFRYALERWECDDYQVILYQPDSGDEAGAKLTNKLASARINADLLRRHYDQLDPPQRSLFESSPTVRDHSQSYFFVQAPGRTSTVFHAPVSDDSLATTIDSPVRRELSRRLLSGHAIVWLLVASADEKQNQKARQLLTNSIKVLAKRVELPAGIGLPGSELHSEVPLILRFSVLEIQPGNPDESFLRELFFGYHGDDPGTVVVPVFGRGRALEVIPATQLNESLIEGLTVYLCGACSCQVKERNPGFDLLIATDWERELFGDQPPPRDQPQHALRRQGDQPPSLLQIPPGKSSQP